MRGTKLFRNGKQVDKVSTFGVRKGIDELCSLVQEHYGKELRTHDLFYSVAGGQIGSRVSYGKGTVFFCCISAWKRADFSGQGRAAI